MADDAALQLALGVKAPTDPEQVALELIVRIPADVLGKGSPPRDALQDFTSLLHAESAFAGMSWPAARRAATAARADRQTGSPSASALNQIWFRCAILHTCVEPHCDRSMNPGFRPDLDLVAREVWLH